MTKRAFCILFITYSVFTCFNVAQADERREDRVLALANGSILATLIVSNSENGRNVCNDNKLACVGGDRAELGILILGESSKTKYVKGLVELVRYQLDGAVSEDFTCYVLEKKEKALASLQRLNYVQLKEQCENQYNIFIKNNPSLGKTNEKTICRSVIEMKQQVTELIQAIKQKRSCGEDF